MSALRPDIQVTIFKDEPTTPSISPEENFKPAEAEIHRWLRCMDDFAKCLDSLGSLPESAKSVKVALIDDGVNLLDERVRNVRNRRIFGGTNSYNSDTGHGTEMAALILSICPMAELWVFKFDMYKTDDGRGLISASSAARVGTTPSNPFVKLSLLSFLYHNPISDSLNTSDNVSALP
jgi:hypothetical protein